MSTLFLFGAGASFGTSHVIPGSPPLSNCLYEELARDFSNWYGLPEIIKSELSDNFEQGMGNVWMNRQTDVAQLMRDMACFFAKYNLDKSQNDLYSKLLINIKKKDILNRCIFSSLNYDMLLEQATTLLGHPFSYDPKASRDPETVSILKLHGSCNFRSEMNATGITFSGVSFDSGVKILTSTKEVLEYCVSTSLYPGMSIFTEGKPTQIAPSVVSEIRRTWQNHVMEAEKALIIGVHPNGDDKHIWDSLEKAPGKIYYIGGEKPFKAWASKRRSSGSFQYLGSEFKAAFDDLIKVL